MTNAITDKTWFVDYKGFQIWITEEQKKALESQIEEGKDFVNIEGRTLPINNVAILSGQDNDRRERIKRGDWKCRYDEWHTKGEECGHMLSGRY